MEKEVLMTINNTSINDALTKFTRNSILFLIDVDKETIGIAILAILTIIGASSYILHRKYDIKNKYIKDTNRSPKVKDYNNYLKDQSRIQNYDFHQILKEFHNACNNSSNIYCSMKCVQLASNFPELINVKLLSDGVTPFHRVCFHGNEPLIELMLAKGADPEIKTIAGENALCIAIYYYLYTKTKDFGCLDRLYEKGSYLSQSDEWYDIFLNLAIKDNNKKLTEWLITHSKPKTQKSFFRASSAPL